ncbi:hypothetical protein IW261DRAFT_1565880 [Armillaria novae-zelandiae]|uniref:Fucose-specific lectin n=1 Tax=Armillaria novae-zelandiae TaxID=153914 RepID=A0AA39TB96_9AGAR|nr:hypothetical protein IW261DRAFT_1565880 [Armillaria novae-zelandiae]
MLATLFTFKNERRKVIENRKLWNFKTEWWFWSSALECKTSGWWKYPITINSLQNIVPWGLERCHYPEGVSEHLDELWGGGHSKDSIFNAMLFTPSAAINLNGGKEVSVPNLLHQVCKSADSDIATNTSIAAIHDGDDQGGVHIRVYCQELPSGAIKELCNDGYWLRGATLPDVLRGSSITAVAYSWNGLQPRVYHQTDDLSIKEHCLNDSSGWFPGKPDFGKAPGCIIGTKNTGSWGPVNKVVEGLKPGTQFAAAQWSNGKNMRLYYQTADDSVLEMVNDGASWVGGASVGNAR